MNKVKQLLCTMDPFLATMNTITLFMLGVLIHMMGFEHVLIVIAAGAVCTVVLAGIGIGIYKAIVYAQSKCKEVQ